jgi:PAS domain S-box-containing protein
MRDPRPLDARWATVLSGLALTLGVLGAASYVFAMPALRLGVVGTSPMKPNTALGIVAAGGALLAHLRGFKRGAQLGAAVALFVGVATLASIALAAPVGIDRLWWSDPALPLRMSAGTATCLASLGAAIALMSFGPRYHRHAQLTVVVALGLALVGLVTFSYGNSALVEFPFLASMAVPTALGIILASVAVLLSTPEGLLTRTFVGTGAAASLGRPLLVATLVLPWALGLLAVQASARFGLGPSYATALLAVLVMAFMTAVVAVVVAFAGRRERDLGATLDSIGDAVLVTDAQGRIERLNPVAERLTGWSLVEARGQPVEQIFTIVDPVTRARIESPVARVLAGGGVENQALLIDRAGQERPISDNGAAVRRADGTLQGAVLVFRDMTSEVEARARVQGEADSLRALMDAASVGLLATRDGRGVYANPVVLRLFGLSSVSELVGRRIEELVAPEEALVTRRRFEAWSAGQLPPPRRLRLRSGEVVDAEPIETILTFDGQPTRLSMLHAVSDQERLEQRLARQTSFALAAAELSRLLAEARFALNESLQIVTRLAVFADDEVSMVRLLGPDGVQLEPALAVHSRTPHLAEAAHRATRTTTPFELESRVLAARKAMAFSGQTPEWVPEPRPLHVALAPLRAAGQLLGVLGVARHADRSFDDDELSFLQDMADRAGQAVVNARLFDEVSKALEALRTTEAQLRQSQKLQAVGLLAGGIAHDFNNLLTVILSLTGLLLEDAGEGSSTRADLLEIKVAGDRAADLTRQLLAFSRKQVMHPRTIELNRVLAELEGMLRRLIGEDIAFTLDLAPGLELVLADPTLVSQVVMNLVVNARDAMPKGGKLFVRTSQQRLPSGRVGELAAGTYVCVAVQDTGVGIPPEVRERLFEPFFTTKPVGKGTGLGLSTSYGIAQQSGGTLTVDSTPGQGSTFTLWLPATSAARTPTPQPLARDGKTEGTILLVEDEASVRDVSTRLLEQAGYEVLVAQSGEEALELAAAAKSLDLLVTDVVMPGLSGREVADLLTKARPGLKVLFMSGYTEDAVVQRGVLAGEVALLEKPFTREGLLAAVRRVLVPLHALPK